MKYDEDGFEIPPGGSRKKRRKPGKKYSEHYKEDDSGGYGNPPVSGQFGPGNGGGPGRPKGSTSLEAALKRRFRRKMPTVREGKAEKLHPTDIFAQRVLEAILGKNPSPRMIELGRTLMEHYGPQSPEEPNEAPVRYDLSNLTDEELEWYGRIAYKLLGKAYPERPVSVLMVPNTWSERTVEGIVREHTSVGSKVSTELVSVGNRAYVSASLPRARNPVDRLRPAARSGGDNADLR